MTNSAMPRTTPPAAQAGLTDTTSAEARELGQFIPLHYHHLMLADQARMSAFKDSIDALVTPGSRVLELGGGTGVLSFFAAKRGARVYCVELNPELLDAAKANLARNPGGEGVELLSGDAAGVLPPEPVDFVICEMLHSALIREKQLSVIASFKANYLARFGAPLPRFLPEATVLAVQPVEQDFDYMGFHCPLPVFQDPSTLHGATTELAEPLVYAAIDYGSSFPLDVAWTGEIPIARDGVVTALRFITKALVSILPEEHRSIDWYMSHMVIPAPRPLEVRAGARLRIALRYPAGGSIEQLAAGIELEPMETIRVLSPTPALRATR